MLAGMGRVSVRLPRGTVADAVVAVTVGVFVAGATAVSAARGEARVDVLGWVLVATSACALYWRRRHPVAVLAFTLLACALYYPLTGPGSPILLTFMVAMFSVGEAGRLGVAVGAGLLALGLTVLGEAASERRHLDDISLFLLVGWLVACVAVGGVVRARRAYLRETERAAATEERLRIARELHDVLGHDLSLINVQTAAALHRMDKGDTAPSRAALAAAKEASGRALRELRRTLGVLRQVDEPAPLAPSAGLGALPELLDRSRSAGLSVRESVTGAVRAVPPAVDVAAYRIVQEALTNVTRHAEASTVDVQVAYGEREVEVRVSDDGRGPACAVTGTGILGMTERAAALGGTLEAAARPEGGFLVRARLPFGGAA
jgi:signal transduction histidine kinase